MPAKRKPPHRKAAKKERAKPMFDVTEATQPVDPELFLWCQNVYAAAAHLTMPVENPAARPLVEHQSAVYVLSDIPINRGMLAATKELRQRGVDDGIKQAVLCRLMHFGEIFQNRERLQAFIRLSDEAGTVMVSEALIKACATVKLIVEDDKLRFDIEDIARVAQELTDAEEVEDKA